MPLEKMSKAGRGGKGWLIPEGGNGDCKVWALHSPVRLECRTYTNLLGFGCLLHKQWKELYSSSLTSSFVRTLNLFGLLPSMFWCKSKGVKSEMILYDVKSLKKQL